MMISSRTPEGLPHRCPICGNSAALEPSYPGGDACCPSCGHLLWWFRDRLSATYSLAADEILFESKFADVLQADSLEIVEIVMQLEEEFDVNIPDEDAAKILSVQDAIHYVQKHRASDR
jgi:acyl carrier protein